MLDLVHTEPESNTTRSVGRQVGISHSTVNRIIRADPSSISSYTCTRLGATSGPANRQRFLEENTNNETFIPKFWGAMSAYSFNMPSLIFTIVIITPMRILILKEFGVVKRDLV